MCFMKQKMHWKPQQQQASLKICEITHLLKHFYIGNRLVIFMKFMFDSFKTPISNILIHFQNKVGQEQSLYGV
jgi:hypothetical protein